jgi:late embryogenesis abundant protein
MSMKAVSMWLALGVLALLQCACASSAGALRPPQVQLTGLAVLQPSQRFRVSLLLTNATAEAVPVDSLRFSIRLGGEGLLDGRTAGPVTVPPNAVETLRVDVDGDMVSSVSRLIAMQGPQSALPYEIAGDLTLDRKAYSFNSAGQVPFSATADR